MKEILNKIHKAFENKTRLGIMSALVVNDQLDFNELKALLNASDGNLASHLKSLEKYEFILVNKQFIDRKPNTNYQLTEKGRAAFEKHLEAIEALIKMKNK